MRARAVEIVLGRCLGLGCGEAVLVVTDPGMEAEARAFHRHARALGWEAALLSMPPPRSRGEEPPSFVAEALRSVPPGRPCILLSHSPLGAEEASGRGASAMLSGHTHGGQIWPFGLVVRLFYPRLAGAYAVGPLSLYVCRGTGTWGPPMRLFRRGEVVLFVLEPKGATP